jgi:hypothetical protein
MKRQSRASHPVTTRSFFFKIENVAEKTNIGAIAFFARCRPYRAHGFVECSSQGFACCAPPWAIIFQAFSPAPDAEFKVPPSLELPPPQSSYGGTRRRDKPGLRFKVAEKELALWIVRFADSKLKVQPEKCVGESTFSERPA